MTEHPDARAGGRGEELGRSLLATGVAVGAGVAGAHLGGDPGAALAAGVGPLADLLFSKINDRRRRHLSVVIVAASNEAHLSAEDLLDRLLVDDLRGELAARVLIAAQDAGTEERLRALSRSLANGALAEEMSEVEVEVLYARALADLDSPHIHVLSLFEKTWIELGLSEHDTHPPGGLNHQQVSVAAGLGVALDPVLGVLVQHGLLQESQPTGGMTFSGGLSRGQFALTDFGHSLLERMGVIGRVETLGVDGAAVEPPDFDEDSCLVCGRPAEHRLIPSATHVGVSDPAHPGETRYQALPRMPLCGDHVDALIAERLEIGWCVRCERWGEMGTSSPCGARYERPAGLGG